MRKNFDSQLDTLSTELITMGAMCEEAISYSSKALLEHEESLIKKVFETDRMIDEKEREIEGKSMRMLLQQQPVARDLRTISAALRMISDMERIGDQAADIAEISQYVTENNLLVKVHIAEMSEHAIKMVKDSVDSFVRKDIETVKNVISHDDIVDGLFFQVKSELTKVISETPEKATLCLDLLMIAKYLERIGDHAVNIAEWVEYSITGVHVTDEVPRV